MNLEVDLTEVQMISEALRRVKPFAEMSDELRKTETNLELKVNRVYMLLRFPGERKNHEPGR